MSRSAGLLLVLGLAFGLWVGFNPQAHRQAVQTWEEAKADYVHFQSQAAVKVGDWTSNVGENTQVQVNSKPAQPLTSSPAWKQLSSALDAFWNSVQRMWTRLTAGVTLTL